MKGKQAYFKEIEIVLAMVLTMVFRCFFEATARGTLPNSPSTIRSIPPTTTPTSSALFGCLHRLDSTIEDFRTVINDFELIYLPKWFEFESQRNKTNNDHFDSRAKLFYMKRVLLIKLTLVVWYRFYTTTFDMILNQYLDDTIARCTISDRSDRTELFLLSWCHKYNPTIN